MIQVACLERLAQDRPTLLRAAWSLRLLDTPRSGQALGWMFIDPSQNRAHRALSASNVCVDSTSNQICVGDDPPSMVLTTVFIRFRVSDGSLV